MNRRVRGIAMSYIAVLINVVVTLLFTPFLINTLGKEGYGLVSLAIAFLSYLNILDFGISDSLLRFFVRYRDDQVATQSFLSRMSGVYLIIGLIIVGLGMALSNLFPVLFSADIGPDRLAELQDMIVVMAFGASVQVGLNPISALAYAHERHFFMKLLESVTLIGTTLVTIVLLLMDYGPYSVVAVAAAGKIVQRFCQIWYIRISIGATWNLALVEARELRQVVAYAAPIFASMVAGAIFWRLDSILIGSMIGLAPVAVYGIGVTFNKYFTGAATALSRVLTPQIIRLVDGGANSTSLTDEMIRISRLQALMLLLILGGLVVFGKRFIGLWLGSDFFLSYWVMLVVLVPYTLELTGNARNIILQVKSLYWEKTAITFLMAILNIPLTILLLKSWGVLGAAISTGTAVLLGYFLTTLLLRQRVGVEVGRYWKQTGSGILTVAVLLIVAGLILERQLPNSWLALVVGVLIYTFAYVFSMYRFAMVDDERVFVTHFLNWSLTRGKGA